MEEQIKNLQQEIADLQDDLVSYETLVDLLDEIDAIVETLLNSTDVQTTTPVTRIKSNVILIIGLRNRFKSIFISF